MALANYTTTVDPEKSVAVITKDLVKGGARGIVSEYANDGALIGLSFAIPLDGEVYHYRLPVRVEAVQSALKKDGLPPSKTTREHAARVAWAIQRDWIRAQMAVLATEMVSLRQVMLPYLVTDSGQTLFDRWEDQRLQLEA